MLKEDALRYMGNPTKDGYSVDYFPERKSYGVHDNAGIANLSYVLLVQGGSHPRNKTNDKVKGIGLKKAEQIFYRALTTYFTKSTQFIDAKTATINSAEDLYGASSNAKEQVELAWCAVGVGSCSDDGDSGSFQLTVENGSGSGSYEFGGVLFTTKMI